MPKAGMFSWLAFRSNRSSFLTPETSVGEGKAKKGVLRGSAKAAAGNAVAGYVGNQTESVTPGRHWKQPGRY
ncbi:hypothetical protein K2X85_04530 [bacterium]|nr:hypothetical protein [bacterium]